MSRANFLFGFLTGALLTTVFAIYCRDQGREECDRQLPHYEECVQKWVPPKEATQAAEAA